MKKVILVIAGNYKQYLDYLRKNNLSQREAAYIDNWQKAAGSIAEKVVTVGTWYEVKNVGELIEFCNTRVR